MVEVRDPNLKTISAKLTTQSTDKADEVQLTKSPYLKSEPYDPSRIGMGVFSSSAGFIGNQGNQESLKKVPSNEDDDDDDDDIEYVGGNQQVMSDMVLSTNLVLIQY